MGRSEGPEWAIEYVQNGRKTVHLHHSKNSTPEEAKEAFAAEMGIPWKELEKRGAKVVERETSGGSSEPKKE
jgi:hypothetical protein